MTRRRIYDWEEWFDEATTTLVRGVDYLCSQSSMVAMIRNNASERGIRVRVTDDRDSITIEVFGEIQSSNKTTVTG